MAIMSFNLSSANRSIKPDWYEFKVTKVELKTSKEKQTPMMVFTCAVISDGDNRGFTITNRCIAQDNIAFKNGPFFDVLGVDTKDESGKYTNNVKVDSDDLLGKKFWAEVISKKDNTGIEVSEFSGKFSQEDPGIFVNE